MLTRHRGAVLAVAFTPDGHTVLTASADESLVTWVEVQAGTRFDGFVVRGFDQAEWEEARRRLQQAGPTAPGTPWLGLPNTPR